MTVGAGAVWILNHASGTVTRVDPATGTAGTAFRVGTGPNDITFALGAVWTGNQDGTVSRIDTVSGSVETIRVGRPVQTIAVDPATERLWVGIGELHR